jgi:hypothetical protein
LPWFKQPLRSTRSEIAYSREPVEDTSPEQTHGKKPSQTAGRCVDKGYPTSLEKRKIYAGR